MRCAESRVFQVETLQSKLMQSEREIGGKSSKVLTSQDAARELIADITSTLNVRSSRVLQASSATSPRNSKMNLNALHSNVGLGEVISLYLHAILRLCST